MLLLTRRLRFVMQLTASAAAHAHASVAPYDPFDELQVVAVQAARKALVEFYNGRDPTKLSQIDGILARFAGKEGEIHAMIQKTLMAEAASSAPAPPAPPATNHHPPQ
jgi:hypothetical protein